MNIRDKILEFPLIQGGMGVGISLGGLAGAVMKEGCMGVISAAHPGFMREDFDANPERANLIAIEEEVEKARSLSEGKGLLGVNLMCATKGYGTYAEAIIRAGADAVISGAGLPLDLPKYAKGKTLMAPIVSGGKAIELICRVWDKRYNCIPDFIVAESSEAGGHLGFKLDDIENGKCRSLLEIIKDIRRAVKPFEEKYNYHIPLFGAGGVFDKTDMDACLESGADGVQIGSRFIATHECDASDGFKNMIVGCKQEDLGILRSPVGLPARGIISSFVKKARETGNTVVKECINCLTPCNPSNTPYCISKALFSAAKGDKEKGVFFCGSKAYKIDKIVSVKELIDEFRAKR
ncbi:MAG: nitronate monooxygenase [Peptostreptococcaceae bacterium]|nr:nitronate monooxygenase [Peptostreptococcaceae bacterium]MDY5739818.1 nitronate monooxygenase [Anaerovoracaceae bacterium]